MFNYMTLEIRIFLFVLKTLPSLKQNKLVKNVISKDVKIKYFESETVQ